VTVTPNPDGVTRDAESVTPGPESVTPDADGVTYVRGERAAARLGVTTDAVRALVADVTERYANDPTRCDFCEEPLSEAAIKAGRSDCGDVTCRKRASRRRAAQKRDAEASQVPVTRDNGEA